MLSGIHMIQVYVNKKFCKNAWNNEKLTFFKDNLSKMKSQMFLKYHLDSTLILHKDLLKRPKFKRDIWKKRLKFDKKVSW